MNNAAHGKIAACSDDPLLGDLMHPWRREYPSDFIAYFRRRFERTLSIASHHHVVTCEVDEGREAITGYAEWHRRRADDKKHAVGATTTAGAQDSVSTAKKSPTDDL